MVAQVYDTQRNNFLTAFIPQEPPYSFDFYLGEFTPWTAIKNSSNEFISLGGSHESPLIYKYQNTGVTDFTFSILAPNYPNQSEIINSLAYYELWIDGDKPYYFLFGEQRDMLFTRTVSVCATKDQTTKFKFRLTILFFAPTAELKQYYFEGDPNIVYSSVTAKFISDSAPLPSSLPIVYLSSPQSLTTNTISVFTTAAYSYPLPTVSSVNDILELKMQGADSYTITQGDGQKISVAGIDTTVGTAGSILCNGSGDWIRLVCTEANKSWMEIGMSGDSFIVT